jgi:hypothetical protein
LRRGTADIADHLQTLIASVDEIRLEAVHRLQGNGSAMILCETANCNFRSWLMPVVNLSLSLISPSEKSTSSSACNQSWVVPGNFGDDAVIQSHRKRFNFVHPRHFRSKRTIE